MNKVKQLLLTFIGIAKNFLAARKNVAIRFFFTLFFICAWKITHIFIFFLTIFQFIFLFATTKHSKSIKTLSHKLTVYSYKMMRYMTLNENAKPYPFGPLAEELEPAEDTDLSNPVVKSPEAVSAEPVQETEPAAKPAADDDETQEAIIIDKE